MAGRDWPQRLLPAALLTSWVALYSGFPLCYFDTSEYLYYGQVLAYGHLPPLFDRPLTYGLFLAPFLKLARHGLLGVPLVQGLLVALAVSLALRAVRASPSTRGFLGLFTVLAASTPLPWFAGQLMPDIFTGLVVLLAFAVLWGDEALTRAELWVTAGLLTFAIATHLSHFPLYGALLVAGLGFRAIVEGKLGARRLGRIAARAVTPLLVAAGLVMAPNWYLYREPVLSRGAALFTLAHLIGDGVAQEYLDSACPTRPYLLCPDRASLRADSDWFLWSPTGPWERYRLRGGPDSSTFLAEAPAIVRGALRQEWRAEIGASLRHSAAQLVAFRISPELATAGRDSRVAQVRRSLPPTAFEAFAASRQVRQALPVEAADVVQRIVVGLSVLVLLACLPGLRRRAEHRLMALIATVCAGVLLNAMVIGFLGSVHDRYQSRVIWLVPLAALVAGAPQLVACWKALVRAMLQASRALSSAVRAADS